jgi:sugar phosphate permease
MPSKRKHHAIFYGWWIVGSSSLLQLLTGGFVTLGFTAFFEPIADEFGWSYTQISLAASLRGLEAGLLAPLVGFLIDRWGPRRLVFAGITITGLGLLLVSRINSLGMYYAGFALIAMGLSGCSPTAALTAAANWFRKKVGIATGIITSGFACGGLLVLLIVKLIDAYDWRTTLIILGITIWVIGIPLSLLLRHKPEPYGYLPDGEEDEITTPDQTPTPADTNEVNISTKQALGSRTFWHITLAMAFQLLAIGTVSTHIMPYLSSVSIQRSTSSLVAMALPLVSITGRLGSGWLSDRFSKKLVATGFFAVMLAGLLCLNQASREAMWIMAPFIILFGMGWGGNNTIRASLMREYFGRSNFGSIFGFLMGTSVLATMAGPVFAGWVFDTWGSYQIAWITLIIIVSAGMILMATTPPVTTRAQMTDRH